MNRRTMQRLTWAPDRTGHTGIPLLTLRAHCQTQPLTPAQLFTVEGQS